MNTTKGSGLRAKGLALALIVLPIALAALTVALAGQGSNVESKVDAVFAKWTSSTPGCVVGVANNGKPVLAKGYGMADLEHDVRLSPDSILEPGSVTKQFTAAAVMLLARDGKLSLDDQVRTYVPELPDESNNRAVDSLVKHFETCVRRRCHRRDGVSRSEPCGVSRQVHEKRRGARRFAAV